MNEQDEFSGNQTLPIAYASDKPPSPLKAAWITGNRAAWQNRSPGLCLWGFGTLIIVGYYFIPAVRSVLDQIGRWKTEYGLWFSVLSTSVFGGLLPTVIPGLFGRKLPKAFWALLISNCIFCALKGLEVDLLYQLQAYVFGDDNDFSTICKKVFVDQVFYAPAIGLFNCVLFYIWRDNGYSFSRTRTSLGKNWYLHKVLPALISNWCVWCPAVILIYALPLALQLPVQNLILCFWVLILVFFTNEDFNEDEAVVGETSFEPDDGRAL